MRIEILLFIVASLIVANIYYEGKVLKKLLSWKKYYKMAGVLLAFFVFYFLIKKNPLVAQNILTTSNEYIKYLPIDKNTMNLISPVLDFSSKSNWSGSSGNFIGGGEKYPIIEVQKMKSAVKQRATEMGGKFKRSVSETKKKYISAQQGWKCYNCKQQLSAFYEVDHIVPLYKGGSNDLTNLVSLCRECHSKKTAMDRMKDEDKHMM
jgi:5-methylcytosine-specific restriction protein A